MATANEFASEESGFCEIFLLNTLMMKFELKYKYHSNMILQETAYEYVIGKMADILLGLDEFVLVLLMPKPEYFVRPRVNTMAADGLALCIIRPRDSKITVSCTIYSFKLKGSHNLLIMFVLETHLNSYVAEDRIFWLIGQYHACWYPGSRSRQGISRHDIDCVGEATCNDPTKRISSACVKPNMPNDSKRECIFVNL